MITLVVALALAAVAVPEYSRRFQWDDGKDVHKNEVVNVAVDAAKEKHALGKS